MHADFLGSPPRDFAKAGVDQLAIYHMVPPPQNALFAKIFLRESPAGTILTEDGMLFELPAGREDVVVIEH